MIPGESELDMARRHVAQSERHIRHQHEIIDHLRGLNAPTEMAEKLLRQFEELLVMHRRHVVKLEREQAA